MGKNKNRFNERRDKFYHRKELVIPKDGTVLEDTEAMMDKLGLSFNGYVLRALTEQIKRDTETLDSLYTQYHLVADELELSLRRQYKPGYVFDHRENADTEEFIKKFDTREEADAFIRMHEVHTKIKRITSRMGLCKEFRLLEVVINGITGEEYCEPTAVWTSDVSVE